MTGGLAAVSSPSALWYLTRGTGSSRSCSSPPSCCFGVSGATRWRTERLPRFVVAGLHRT